MCAQSRILGDKSPYPSGTGSVLCPRATDITTRSKTPFLAVDEEVYNHLFEEPIGELLLENQRIRLIVFDPHTETIRLWIPQNPIAS